jgi:hypothetical protein
MAVPGTRSASAQQQLPDDDDDAASQSDGEQQLPDSDVAVDTDASSPEYSQSEDEDADVAPPPPLNPDSAEPAVPMGLPVTGPDAAAARTPPPMPLQSLTPTSPILAFRAARDAHASPTVRRVSMRTGGPDGRNRANILADLLAAEAALPAAAAALLPPLGALLLQSLHALEVGMFGNGGGSSLATPHAHAHVLVCAWGCVRTCKHICVYMCVHTQHTHIHIHLRPGTTSCVGQRRQTLRHSHQSRAGQTRR